MFAKNLTPPYYAVIFTNQHTGADYEIYEKTGNKMAELAATMPGYLGIESTRDAQGFGITVSYWETEEAIKNWHEEGRHVAAQNKGKQDWYEHYECRIAKVDRSYAGPKT